MLTSIIRMKLAAASSSRTSPAAAPLFQVAQARLVAMMAVGDEHRLRPHQPGDRADDVLVADRPQPADDAQVIGRLERQRRPTATSSSACCTAPSSSGYRPKTGLRFMCVAWNSFRRSAFGAGHRLLVRIDAALAERLQADAGQEALAREALALDLEVLVIDVQAAGRVLGQHAVGLPVAQAAGGAGVAVVRVGVAAASPC